MKIYPKQSVYNYLTSFDRPIDLTISQLLNNVNYNYIRHEHRTIDEYVTVPVECNIVSEVFTAYSHRLPYNFLKRFLEYCYLHDISPDDKSYTNYIKPQRKSPRYHDYNFEKKINEVKQKEDTHANKNTITQTSC